MRTMKKVAYRGVRVGGSAAVLGTDGREINPRLDVCGYAPEGLDWGDGGPAAAQAAVAVLASHLADTTDLGEAHARGVVRYLYPKFLKEVVRLLPDEWLMEARTIDEFRAMADREGKGLPVSWPLWLASCYERELLVAVSGRPVFRR